MSRNSSKDSGRIIYELKYKYNRPRPIQVKEFLQLEDFDTTTLDSMVTHLTQVDIQFKVYLLGGHLEKCLGNIRMNYIKLER